MGWAQWFQSILLDKVENFVDPVLAYMSIESFNKSLELVEKHDSLERYVPRIKHQLASIKWHLAVTLSDDELKEEAISMNNEALSAAADIDEIRYIVDSLLGDAEFALASGWHNQIPEIGMKLQKYENEYPLFVSYYGRMRKYEGDVLFEDRKYDAAFNKYAEAYPMIAQHGVDGPYSIGRELQRLQKKLYDVNRIQKNDPERVDYLQRLGSAWREQCGSEDCPPYLDYLIFWYEQRELVELPPVLRMQN